MSKNDLDTDPFRLADTWLAEAAIGADERAGAVALATATPDGMPSVRIVLLKDFTREGAVFFTNYRSRKAGELERNPRASLLMWWPEQGRQLRLEGTVARVAAAESDAYFASRARGSREGAWASPQSAPLESREQLMASLSDVQARYAGAEIPRPPHWGGYRLAPVAFEFWTQGECRLHDRFRYERHGNAWQRVRLAP